MGAASRVDLTGSLVAGSSGQAGTLAVRSLVAEETVGYNFEANKMELEDNSAVGLSRTDAERRLGLLNSPTDTGFDSGWRQVGSGVGRDHDTLVVEDIAL